MSDFENNYNENNINEEKDKEEKREVPEYTSYSREQGDGMSSSIEYSPAQKKEKKSRRALGLVLLAACFVCAVFVSSFAGYYFGAQKNAHSPTGDYGDTIYGSNGAQTSPTNQKPQPPRPPETTVVMQQHPSQPVSREEGSFVYVNEKASPSVVSIVTEAISYNIFYGNYVESGAGSGVIIARSGNSYYIITNNHVVDGYSNIMVHVAGSTDEKGYTATVMGTDWTNDIAIIRIESEEELTVASLSTSDSVVTGQDVAAIGNPLGMFSGTITPGIISSVAREVEIEGVKMDLLQHSASVSPGNSGGGLFDMEGKLIGIVNAKSSGTGVEGIGFAIPIDTAIRVADDIINRGYATGIPYLGISFQSSLYIKSYQYNDELAASGQQQIMENDILTAIDGVNVSSTNDIRSVLSSKEIGDKAKLKLMRIVQTNGYRYTYESYEVEAVIHEYVPTVQTEQ